jgi:hypothetical protein
MNWDSFISAFYIVVFASGGEEDGAARRLAAEIGGFF